MNFCRYVLFEVFVPGVWGFESLLCSACLCLDLFYVAFVCELYGFLLECEV